MLMIVLALVVATTGYTQNINGSLAGRVVDQQGAVVPNASVIASDLTQKLNVTTKTNDQGTFVLAGLRPGNYSLRVEAAGFKKLDRPNIALNADEKLAIGDLVMEVGALTETVEVSAQATILQTESAERSDTIIESRLRTYR